jgi:3-carboxy-cis,cis-muconate cycloisomerase
MSISAFEHPLLSALLGDEEIAGQFSAEADIAAMLVF